MEFMKNFFNGNTYNKLGLKAPQKVTGTSVKYFSLTSPAIVDVLTADSGVFVKFVTVTVTEEPNLV